MSNGIQRAWYAVRTVPGFQKPQRQFSVEPTQPNNDGTVRGKGYKIAVSMNPNISAIELALSNAGFDCYMPAEKRLVRDRKHTDLWKVRRFALMVGYVFVREPHDFYALSRVRGVAGIVSNADGRPLPIDILEIMAVRSVEAQAEVDFDAQSRAARQKVRRKAKEDPRLKKLVSKLDISGNFSIPTDFDFEAA